MVCNAPTQGAKPKALTACTATLTRHHRPLRTCRHVVLAPLLALHELLCAETPTLAAPSARAPGTMVGVAAWARSMHSVLVLMTEPLGTRVDGIVQGTAATGAPGRFK